MGVKVTLSGFQEEADAINSFQEAVIRGALDEVIEYLATASPVDTGAYIESHSIKSNNTRGRGYDSKRRKRGSGGDQNREIALNQLLGDVEKLDFESDTITVRNDSPHAVFVEYKHGYYIYEGLGALQFSGEPKGYGKNYERYYGSGGEE